MTDAPDESHYRIELLVANAQTNAAEAACQSLSDTVRQQAKAIVHHLSEIEKLNDRLQQAQAELAEAYAALKRHCPNPEAACDKPGHPLPRQVLPPTCVKCSEMLREGDPAFSGDVCAFCGYWGIPVGQQREDLRTTRALTGNPKYRPERRLGDYSHPNAGKSVMVRRIHKDCGGEMGPPTAENINGLCQKCFSHPFPQNIQSVEGLRPSHTTCGHPCVERIHDGKPAWYCLDCSTFVAPDRLSVVWSAPIV